MKVTKKQKQQETQLVCDLLILGVNYFGIFKMNLWGLQFF